MILPGRDPTAAHISSWRKYTQKVTKIKGTDSVVVQQFLRKTKRLFRYKVFTYKAFLNFYFFIDKISI